jgi:hypothetical protein
MMSHFEASKGGEPTILDRVSDGWAVPQRVQMDGLVDLGHPRCGATGPVELTRREWVDWVLPRKQPALRSPHLPPGPQQIEEMRM